MSATIVEYGHFKQATEDITMRIKDDDFLASWGVFQERTGELEWDANRENLLWMGKDGASACGAAVVIGRASLRVLNCNTRNPPMEVRIPVTVYEQPEMNRNTDHGTGICVEQAVQRLIQLLECFETHGLSGGFHVAPEERLEEVIPFEFRSQSGDEDWRCCGYTFNLIAAIPNEAVDACTNPVLEITELSTPSPGASHRIKITPGHPDDVICYTLDGSMPASPETNPQSQIFTNDIITGPTADITQLVVRVVAKREGCIPSDAVCEVIENQ